MLDKLDSTYYKAVDDAQLHAAAIDGMVAALDDPYTVYWDPEEYAVVQGRAPPARTPVWA